MLLDLFPEYFYSYLKKTPVERINEIRLRINKKVVLQISNKSYYLYENGLTGKEDVAVIATKELIDEVLKRGCESSVYAFNNQIRNGFITIKGGIRIGLSGEGVVEKGMVKTLKNISGIAIRLPHEVIGCSKNILPYLLKKDFLNTLIVSPPGAGKTTLIRDIVLQMSNLGYCYNVLVVDERFEIANCFNGVPTLSVGNFCDVLSGVSKGYAFENGIRSLRPDIIVTDEISNVRDYEAILSVSTCGVGILASIHAKSLEDLKNKKDFELILRNKVFSRIVVLSQRNGPGTIEGIYDESLRYLSI